ncbi:MAG: hypothetical protein U1C58_06190 [Flavobacteriaceae bacterium]|nr:hypothetical protein [Flavobacteriaceae bacterium]MDZ4147854.1 hypothetical protein [Flavobacteriaceae bacterium]
MSPIQISMNRDVLSAIDRLMASLCNVMEMPVDVNKRSLLSISRDVEVVIHRRARAVSCQGKNAKKMHKVKLKYHEAAVLEVLLRASSNTEVEPYNRFSFRSIADQLNQKLA